MEYREWIDKTEDKSADTIERCHGFKKKKRNKLFAYLLLCHFTKFCTRIRNASVFFFYLHKTALYLFKACLIYHLSIYKETHLTAKPLSEFKL